MHNEVWRCAEVFPKLVSLNSLCITDVYRLLSCHLNRKLLIIKELWWKAESSRPAYN